MARKIPWIGTSWKMNKRAPRRALLPKRSRPPRREDEAAQLFVIPPFPYIADVADICAEPA